MFLCMIFSALVATGLVTSVSLPDIDEKIVNISGRVRASIEDVPYHVSVMSNGRHICDGVIIRDDTVVTSKECAIGTEIRAGSNYAERGGTIHNVTLATRYTSTIPWFDGNIAVLKVSPKFIVDQTRKPIDLYYSMDEIENDAVGTMSWFQCKLEGVCDSSWLVTAKIPISTDSECKSYYDKDIKLIEDEYICSGTLGAKLICPGEEGSPFVVNGKLAAIGLPILPCHGQDPLMYTNISYFAKWITGLV